MFKVLVLQRLHILMDEQIELRIRDRYSFCRFLGLSPDSQVPDARTVWMFRERLKDPGARLIARKLQIVDTSFVAASHQRNSNAENEAIKNMAIRPGSGKTSPIRCSGNRIRMSEERRTRPSTAATGTLPAWTT